MLRPAFGWLPLVLLGGLVGGGRGAEFASHPPMRPLPEVSRAPLGAGAMLFVDATRGDDEADGSVDAPLRTIAVALRRARPGTTVVLRGGTYYEHLVPMRSGEEGRPIILRSHPWELAVVDGGLREFVHDPAGAWEPYPDGAPGEYVSTRTYPQHATRPIVHQFPANGWEPFHGKEDDRPRVLGHFADSLVPLHGYRVVGDLRDDSMLWDVSDKGDVDEGVYCGPGLWFDRETHRIHVRLAHTDLAGLGDRSYRGETDPRRIPLLISGPHGADVLRVNGLRHVEFRDLVFRGAAGSPLVNLAGSSDVTFDGCTFLGGAPGLLIRATQRLRVTNSAFRGLSAPWSSRASNKYRGTPGYRVITLMNQPRNEDFEFANNEFTDGHDGLWLRYAHDLRFHRNLVSNFDDDGFEVGARKRDHRIVAHQNLFERCGLTFTLHEMERDEAATETDPGAGIYLTRNVVDLRFGVFKAPPREPDPAGAFLESNCSLCGDHGGPVWPDYRFYHNTVLRTTSSWRGYYGFGMGGRGLGKGATRRVLNSAFVQVEGMPGLNFTAAGDVFVDGNLHWGLREGPAYSGDFFAENGHSYVFKKEPRPKEWMVHDLLADPRFVAFGADGMQPIDLRPSEGSPLLDAAITVPVEWPDPLRDADEGRPDIGAFPRGVDAWSIGIRGRFDAYGRPRS